MILFVLLAGLVAGLAAGCGGSARPIGQWTNATDGTVVLLDENGKPTTPVPVGEWYRFNADGSYYKVARYMTFAIGGVSVVEGRYTVQGTALKLVQRTESFFPDEGSPQPAKSRVPLADEAEMIWRTDRAGGVDTLYLSSGADQPEIAFRAVKE